MASLAHSPDNDLQSHPQGPASNNQVELNELNPSADGTGHAQAIAHPDPLVATSSSPGMSEPTTALTAEAEPVPKPTTASAEFPTVPSALLPSSPASASSSPPQLSRLDSVAIGAALDAPLPDVLPTADEANPVLMINLLLTSGARHPYKLDDRYLTKRNVPVPGVTESGKKDPFSISVYTLKELILREWREEWEVRPSSPSSIRLIHFGRLLDDKALLKGSHVCHENVITDRLLMISASDCRFSLTDANVVHMTVKPQEVVDDEEASKSKAQRGERDGSERTPGCRCVIL